MNAGEEFDEWTESNGGPLLLVSDELACEWLGTEAPTDGRIIEAKFRWNEDSPPCDYDRACDIRDYVGSLAVGWGTAIVLWGEPLPTLWRPCSFARGGLLVRWMYAESDEAVMGHLSKLTRLEFELTDHILETNTGRVAMFDSAFPGGEFAEFGAGRYLSIGAGRFRLGTAEWKPDEQTEMVLHPLVAV